MTVHNWLLKVGAKHALILLLLLRASRVVSVAATLQPLGDLPGGTFASWAGGVSADGSVVVSAGTPASGYGEAFRWTPGGGMVGLGVLPGGYFYSGAAGVSADGRVSAAPGVRTPITSRASQRHAQRRRAEVDAVAIGIETLLVDDPLLTVRDVYRMRPLTRVVFDRSLRTPPSARMLSTLESGPVVLVTGREAADTDRAARLRELGATVAAADRTVNGMLRVLADLGVQSLLLEGGPRLHGAFAEAGMIDEVEVYVAQGVVLPDGVPLASGLPLAGLADLDTPLAKGYEGGTDLSGGQWQRVALARALCAVRQGAGVVILDEPTAQLDVRGEAEIFERILAATRDCITILVSHRFSTVRHADRICVLEHGRVVELGTHQELMDLRGRYRTMFDLQAQRFGATADEEGTAYEQLA